MGAGDVDFVRLSATQLLIKRKTTQVEKSGRGCGWVWVCALLSWGLAMEISHSQKSLR